MTDDERAKQCVRFVRRLAAWRGEVSGTCMREAMAEAREVMGLRPLELGERPELDE